MLFAALSSYSYAQLRVSNLQTSPIANATESSAFLDASSDSYQNSLPNIGKGLLFPRVDLTTFTFSPDYGTGKPSNYPTYFDGMIVYNTATSGTALQGFTEGTLSRGFWYYDNESEDPAGGTWKALGGCCNQSSQSAITFAGGTDPTVTPFPATGGTTNPLVPQSTPACTQNPPYSFAVKSGGDFMSYTVTDATTGTFTITMTPNPSTNTRTATLTVTNNCTSVSQDFVLTQAGGAPCTVPATPGAISGIPSAAIDLGATFTATVTAVSGATSYVWTLPTGLTGTSTTNSITITGATAGAYAAGTIKVAAVNTCGTSATSNSAAAVTVNSCSAAPATPGAISGLPSAAIDLGATFTATVTAVSGATSYVWTLPTGLTGTSTTNSVTITAATVGTYAAGTIKVAAVNTCGTSATSNSAAAVTVISCSVAPTQPSTITGSSVVNKSATGLTYSVTNVSGVTYNWTLPSGWTQTAGGTTNSVTVSAPSTAGNYTISVIPSNSCGNGTASTLQVTVGCGAYVSSGVWKEFMCWNLGADQSADPFTPAAALNGDYYQWGSKTSAATRDAINGTWSSTAPTSYYGNNTTATNSTTKSTTDPCPDGYRVPSSDEWNGVFTNNNQTNKGSWNNGNWAGAMFGNSLFLPAAGLRSNSDGSLTARGLQCYFWNSTMYSSTNASIAIVDNINGGHVSTGIGNDRAQGMSIRCIAQ